MPGAALRLVARAAGIDDDALLREIAAELGADVAAPGAPAALPRHGRRRATDPLPPPRALRRARAPVATRELSTADVYREADRLGLPRDAAALAAKLREVSTAAGDLPDELIVNDLEPAARALCPEIDAALAAARGAGAHHALVCGSGPTVIGLFADLQGARAAAARLFDREPAPDRRRAVGGDAVKPVWLVFAAALLAFLVWRRRRLEPTLLAGGALVAAAAFVYGLGVIHFPNLEHLLIDIGERLGKWTYLLVGALAFFETGAFIGLSRPARPRCCSAASSPARARSTS